MAGDSDGHVLMNMVKAICKVSASAILARMGGRWCLGAPSYAQNGD